MTIRRNGPDTDPSKIGIVEASGQKAQGPSGESVQTLDNPIIRRGGVRGDFDIRIAADGTWFHEGRPIQRKELVKLFATVLSRDEAGDFWLRTPFEAGRIQVDDAPFTIVDLDVEGEGKDQKLIFRTNLDEEVAAGRAHPIRIDPGEGDGTLRPYFLVREGLEGLILRAVFYRLAQYAVVGADGRFGVWSDGLFFSLEGEA